MTSASLEGDARLQGTEQCTDSDPLPLYADNPAGSDLANDRTMCQAMCERYQPLLARCVLSHYATPSLSQHVTFASHKLGKARQRIDLRR